jgi:pantetheine-phosphate adenylyltransferase
MKAIFPGSFDPPHLGHIDVIRRAAACAEHLIVAVAVNPDKKQFLTTEARVKLLRAECAKFKNVSVASYKGQTAAFARTMGAKALVRGIRGWADLEAERGMSEVNRTSGGIETMFLFTGASFSHVSSDLVRKALAAGMPLDDLVPAGVREALRKKK